MVNQFEFIEGDKVGIKAWVRGVQLEDQARAQLVNLTTLPFIYKHVAAMPDVHWGKGSTIGSVIVTKGAVIPAAVGVDIGCVDADSEFLSPAGWKRIADYNGEPILQCSQDGTESSWLEDAQYVRLPCSDFLHFKTKYGIDQMLSDEHRVPCLRITGRRRERVPAVVLAGELASEHGELKIGAKVEFQTSFTPPQAAGLSISDVELRVQVMAMADGSLKGKTITCRFKKIRKIERARTLLQVAEIPFTSGTTKEKVAWFRFPAPIPTKTYRGWIPKCSAEQLAIIADECLNWDGNRKDRCFYTRDKDSADFIQYAFAATGNRSVLRTDRKDGKFDYRVFAYEHPLVGLGGSPKSDITRTPSADGFKYCFTTRTGFWIMRRNGQIVITGNCGMIAAQTSLTSNDLPENLHAIRTAIEAAVPHGRTKNGGSDDAGAWQDVPENVLASWTHLDGEYQTIIEKHPKLNRGNLFNHLGTLGTGNHFIEVCLDESDHVWIMLHSGSRGVGNRIGMYFIEKAKEDMRRWFINLPDMDLAYIPQGSELFDDYWFALDWAQRFAKRNREIMLTNTLNALRDSLGRELTLTADAINCHHNYVAWENHFSQNVMVTRKGAVRAREGDMGIIPGSMGAKSFIVRGKGNPESFNSCSHGAGRAMSRGEAKRTFTLEDHAKATEGVECRKDADVIDETPLAYKSIDAVMAAQSDLVEVVHTIKQIVCVKG